MLVPLISNCSMLLIFPSGSNTYSVNGLPYLSVSIFNTKDMVGSWFSGKVSFSSFLSVISRSVVK